MCNVTFNEFSKEFAKDLDLNDESFLTCLLNDLPQYDSMGKITVSLTIENIFGFQIEFEVLDSIQTIQELYQYCNQKTF